jgi:hypothetical protein
MLAILEKPTHGGPSRETVETSESVTRPPHEGGGTTKDDDTREREHRPTGVPDSQAQKLKETISDAQ